MSCSTSRRRRSCSTSTRSRSPTLDATLVAEHVARQLEQRVSFRRAMKKAIASTMRAGARRHPHRLLGTPRRRRNGAHREVPRGPRAAPHAARRHRFRARHGPHDLRDGGREGVDLQRRESWTSASRAMHRRRRRPGPPRRERAHARTEAGQTSEADARTPEGQGVPRLDRGIRRVRTSGAGSRPGSPTARSRRPASRSRASSSAAERCGSGSSRTSR